MYGPSVQSDVRILSALANPVRYEIVGLLLRQPATQKTLAAQLGLNSGVLSRQMATLAKAGLVSRERSHGPYEVRFPREVVAVLATVANLQMKQAGARASDAARRAASFEPPA